MNAIPLLVVQSKSAAAVEINGTFIGEIGEDSSAVSLPVSHTGNVYVSVLPLSRARGAQLFSVTRKLTFKGGELAAPGNTDGMKITRWPGGVFALELEPGEFEECPPRSFPFTIAALSWGRKAAAGPHDRHPRAQRRALYAPDARRRRAALRANQRGRGRAAALYQA